VLLVAVGEHLERSQAMSALRALARAIDAKDPMTRRHSTVVSSSPDGYRVGLEQ